MSKVLVVDDEKHILDLISFNLAAMGYEVITATDGNTAIEKVRVEDPEIIILDVMLPKMDGLQVCQYLRTNLKYRKPVIMISGKGEVVDKVLGLEVGANDYISKPFSPLELNARVKANLRSYTQDSEEDKDKMSLEENQVASNVIFDEQERRVTLKDQTLELTPKEFELMKVLAKNKGKALRREYLINYVWGSDYQGDRRTLDVHIRYLRQKLIEDTGHEIVTVRSYGYRLEEVEGSS